MDTIRQRNELALDFHHLQVFDLLMTERSITKAARVLNLTQPALSRTLARLPLYFGDPLIRRSPWWAESYASLTRKDHPRIGANPSFESFVAENHALVSAIATGHVLAMSMDLDLQVVEPPFAFPKIEIAQYSHDRVHRDAPNQWIRNVIRDLSRAAELA